MNQNLKMTKEIMMSEAATAKDMIQHALDQNFNKANEVFGEIMSVKINDILDQEKINLASQIYNGVDPEDPEDPEDEDIEQDDDLDDEDWEEEDDQASADQLEDDSVSGDTGGAEEDGSSESSEEAKSDD